MQALQQVWLASIGLSVIHALIPNHWIPLVTVSRAENWSRGETTRATIISGAAHTASTIVVGIFVGFFGHALGSNYGLVTKIVAPSILLVLGLIYIIADIRGSGHGHSHSHGHGHSHGNGHGQTKVSASVARRSKFGVLASISTVLFLSPCVEIEAYYFLAGSLLGWLGIAIVSGVYFVGTILSMVLLVEWGRREAERLKTKLRFLGRHEQTLTGVVLVIFGLLAYFIEI